MLFTIYAESFGGRVGIDTNNQIVQTGKGILIFRNKEERKSFAWCDGKPFKLKLNGCSLLESQYSHAEMYLVGEDYTGAVWDALLNEEIPSSSFIFDADKKKVHFSRTVVAELLRGRLFAEAIEELIRLKLERELSKLRIKAAKVQPLQEALAEVYKINKAAGPQSRKKVEEIILSVEPDLAKV